MCVPHIFMFKIKFCLSYLISKSLTLFGTTWRLILRVVISASAEMPYICCFYKQNIINKYQINYI